jgi:hypothetical protein
MCSSEVHLRAEALARRRRAATPHTKQQAETSECPKVCALLHTRTAAVACVKMKRSAVKVQGGKSVSVAVLKPTKQQPTSQPRGGGTQESFRHHVKKPEPGPGTHPPLSVSETGSYAHVLYLYVV